jgi:Protein of unknown function (DUF2630)
MAKDQDILDQVNKLVAEEMGPRPKGRGELRAKLQHRDIDESEEHLGPRPKGRGRLSALEVALDQCWDLLRQRRALRETGGDPHEAKVRPPGEVEGYLG